MNGSQSYTLLVVFNFSTSIVDCLQFYFLTVVAIFNVKLILKCLEKQDMSKGR